jgi:multiple sugar transport system permease protein
MKKVGRGWLEAAPFLLPNLLGFAAFTAGPVLFSLMASFTNWSLTKPGSVAFVGLQNYVTLLLDPRFWLHLANTGYMMLGIPASIFGSLWLAVLLNRRLPGSTLFRTLLYLPSFTSGVAIMILWKTLYNPDYGPINQALEVLGIQGPNWLLSTQNVLGLKVESAGMEWAQFGIGAKDALVLMGIWTSIGGSSMLLYLAALTNVPVELVEAAELDGANRWKSFWGVVWPQLAPTTFFIGVMSVIGGLQGGFEQARIMTGGGPAGTTTTLAYSIYSKAFEEFQMGYASAVSWTLFAVIFLLTAVYWKFGSRELND